MVICTYVSFLLDGKCHESLSLIHLCNLEELVRS
ncbi:unnamed protein product [Spirodela intermedia]|uniref:Uncharacterized protein n=2 Tax=Spirodela intermedia TaxID=51605 RepID=A0A7I8KJK2_SPIIN|nr:unnamed protein product [Spirodela intermedia]CAA6661592.1 unnamed protein product [Spirodela intermedia]CAA7397969.1 unnamed protein product [Spirodela intermedia]